MRVAGLYTVAQTSGFYENLTVTGGGTGANLFTFASGTNLISDGFRAGQVVTIDSLSNTNEGEATIYTLTTTTASFIETMTTESAAVSLTMTVVVPDKNITDYTEAAFNRLETKGNVIPLNDEVDSKVKLLLHFDGGNNSQTFTDSSLSGHTDYTVIGLAKQTTTAKKFGASSLVCPTDSSYIAYTDSTDWNMGTGRFTVDFWFRKNDATTSGTIFSNDSGDTNNYVALSTSATQFYFVGYNAGTKQWGHYFPFQPISGTWYHVGVIRGWGDNDNALAMTVDGAEIGYTTVSATAEWGNYTSWFYLNSLLGVAGSGVSSDVYIDEFRVSKGIARWTSNFTPRSTSYGSANQNGFLVLTTRPIQAIKPYVSEPNQYSSTLTAKCWSGSSFYTMPVSDGTASSGASLAQTGTVSFSPTTNSAVPLHFDGTYFYSYLFSLDSVDATLSYITVDAPFQPVVDLWDGVDRTCISFQVWRNSDKAYYDFTNDVAYASQASEVYGADLGSLSVNDHIIAMFDDRITAMKTAISGAYANTHTAHPKIDYRTATGWVRMPVVHDTTVSNDTEYNSLGRTGMWWWNDIGRGEEATINLFGKTGYAYSISFNNGLGPDTVIDTVYGVPAQKVVPPVVFPSMYKGRALFCGYKEGFEGNRVDYSVTDAPAAWNGIESSDGGSQSLYFGGGDNMTAGGQLYNRFGSNIYTMWVATTQNSTFVLNGNGPEDFRIYPISTNIGCPAPKTVAFAEMGYQVGSDTAKNIMIWMSAHGPMIFDGAVFYPIRGIDNYFNPQKSEYINTSIIDTSVGWYDANYDEYNLIIPSGSSATAPNKWLVYSLRYLKWYEKVPTSTYPISGWIVKDTNGRQHIYSGTTDGYMLRMEATTLWNSTKIAHMWETGDFFPTKSMWDIANIDRFKIYGIKGTETATLTISHYTDTFASTASAPTSLSGFVMSGGDSNARVIRDTQTVNLTAQAHRFRFSVTMGGQSVSQEGFPKPLGWGARYRTVRKDE
uniref:Putative lectin/glucanase superfamily protein n=1 Tax=viral metagenome TaxID=1070528 RepID=A0A6M3IUV0_9ZZZZ